MATATYIALANLTLSGTDSEVSFASIPATYRDLVLIINGTASTGAAINMKVNGSTSSMSYVQMIGDGSTTISSSAAVGSIGALFTNQGMVIINVMDYSATDKHKTVLSRASTAGNDTRAMAGRWASTSAITTFAVYFSSATFSSGTTFALYGIEA